MAPWFLRQLGESEPGQRDGEHGHGLGSSWLAASYRNVLAPQTVSAFSMSSVMPTARLARHSKWRGIAAIASCPRDLRSAER
jgi:hypothetical protein